MVQLWYKINKHVNNFINMYKGVNYINHAYQEKKENYLHWCNNEWCLRSISWQLPRGGKSIPSIDWGNLVDIWPSFIGVRYQVRPFVIAVPPVLFGALPLLTLSFTASSCWTFLLEVERQGRRCIRLAPIIWMVPLWLQDCRMFLRMQIPAVCRYMRRTWSM